MFQAPSTVAPCPGGARGVSGRAIRSAGAQHIVPSVIVLRVHLLACAHGVGATWSRRGVLERDGYRCAYCGASADAVDCILPRRRCRGGQANAWLNTAAACSACNQRKGDRTLAGAGMRSRADFRPHAPRFAPRRMRFLAARPEWALYLISQKAVSIAGAAFCSRGPDCFGGFCRLQLSPTLTGLSQSAVFRNLGKMTGIK
jgi:hypothetical protein